MIITIMIVISAPFWLKAKIAQIHAVLSYNAMLCGAGCDQLQCSAVSWT